MLFNFSDFTFAKRAFFVKFGSVCVHATILFLENNWLKSIHYLQITELVIADVVNKTKSMILFEKLVNIISFYFLLCFCLLCLHQCHFKLLICNDYKCNLINCVIRLFVCHLAH